jgi:hypothetical protein
MRSVTFFALIASILVATVTAVPLVSYTFVSNLLRLFYLQEIPAVVSLLSC